MDSSDRDHDRWLEKITNALRSLRQARWGVVAVGTAVAACAGNDANPPVSPENSIHSSSLDEMPAAQPGGLGEPGGHTDAGLRQITADGGVQRGGGAQ
jgi:hypothetical protein